MQIKYSIKIGKTASNKGIILDSIKASELVANMVKENFCCRFQIANDVKSKTLPNITLPKILGEAQNRNT